MFHTCLFVGNGAMFVKERIIVFVLVEFCKMIIVLFLLLACPSTYCMDQSSQDVSSLVRALQNGEDQKAIEALEAGGVQINQQDARGSYLLHWAVLDAIKKMNRSHNWQEQVETKMKVVDVLLRCGADYSLQERDSKHTIFHILAYHLAAGGSNELIECVLDRVLQRICTVWFSKASTKELGQISFLQEMNKVRSCKNAAGQSVVAIVTHRKCESFFSEERFKRAYESAHAEFASYVESE